MKTAYIHATVLNGTENMVPQNDMTIVVEDGKITTVAKSLECPDGAKQVDLTGYTVVPGLINLHVHLPGSGAPKKKAQNPTKAAQFILSNSFTRNIGMKMCKDFVKTELLSGVTTLRTVGGLADFDSRIRDEVNSGKTDGPRMLVCNTAVSVPGGHMAGSVAYPAKNVDDARNKVREIISEKPDWINIMITGAVLDATVKGEPGVLRMSPECVKACCEEAHKAGFRVSAHVESTEGVRVALENGVDSIEHGAVLTPELVKLFKERSAVDVCTISPAVPYALFDRSLTNATELSQYNGEIVLKGIVSCAKTSLENNIPVGLGTDTACPFVTHYDMWRELEYFHLYTGVSRSFALCTATLKNAQILGIEKETGTVEQGKSADFIAVKGNPLLDLSVLRSPVAVVFRGKLYNHPKVKKMELCEKPLDECMKKLSEQLSK